MYLDRKDAPAPAESIWERRQVPAGAQQDLTHTQQKTF